MSADRALELLALLGLGCVAATGLARALALRARGVWVLPIDRERRLPEALADLGFVLGMAVFLGEAVAAVAAPAWRPGGGRLGELPLPASLRALGLLAEAAGVALYLLALRDLGASWRFTIDRRRAGALVTTGVFAATRNPIYLALLLVALGAALALAGGLLLLLACAAAPYFHHLVLREERFLAAHYGAAWARYRDRVPRWWRPRAGTPPE